jgi:hypothetical protein
MLPLTEILLTLFIYQGSLVALAGSKIDCSKFYYCEKSKDLYSCFLIFFGYITTKAKEPDVNNGLIQAKTGQ